MMEAWKQFYGNLLHINITTRITNKEYQRTDEYVPELTLDEVKTAINKLTNNKAVVMTP